MVIESEREFLVAFCGIRIDTVSVVGSDLEIRTLKGRKKGNSYVSDADPGGIDVSPVALNADKSGLAGLESVDWKVVALVGAGNVVVEVAEEWEGVVEVLCVGEVGALHSESFVIHVSGQVDSRLSVASGTVGQVGADFGSEEPDDIVQVLVAETFKAGPDVFVVEEVGIFRHWEG